MKRKAILSIALAGMLAFGAGLGTMAYFTQTWTSEDNQIKTAEFNVSQEGIENEVFTANKFAPGQNINKPFIIRKNKTEIPYEVIIEIKATDDTLINGEHPFLFSLLEGNTPLEGKYNPNNKSIEFNYVPTEYMTQFMLDIKWPWETPGINDNDFAGKNLGFEIEVTAKQLQQEDGIIHANLRVQDGSGFVNMPAVVTLDNNDKYGIHNIEGNNISYNKETHTITVNGIKYGEAVRVVENNVTSIKYLGKSGSQQIIVPISKVE